MIGAESSALGSREGAVSASRLAVGAIGLAVALSIAAQLRIPLPFTPVPITLQTFVLYLGAAWLGTRAAVPGLLLYVGAALLGAPVMSGFRGGLAASTGATGGYILGWFIAALVLSRLLDGRARSWLSSAGAMAIASLLLLFCGTLHLALLLDLSPWQAFLMGAAPFIPGDLLKISIASTMVRRWPNPLSVR